MSAPDQALSILVIDDEEGMREGMRRVLQKAYGERSGLRVDLAQDGEQAIGLLKQSSYDLALVDLKMPGIDGFEVTRYINDTAGQDTVVVIVSALATVEAAVEVTRHGAFDFLVKPFTPKDLLQVVERALRQRNLLAERQKYLTELAGERNLSRQLINSMQEGVIVVNISRKAVLMNPRAEQLLGVVYAPDLGVERLGFSPEVLARVEGALGSGHTPERGSPVERGPWEQLNGRMLEILVNPYLVEGENSGAIVILDDVTRQWEAEKEKARFIAMVAHELKSPIAAILNYVNIILSGMFDEQVPKIHEMLARSKVRGEALLDLIRDLLFLNQREAGKVERTVERLELAQVLREQLEFFQVQADRGGVRLSLEAEGQFPVQADRKDLDRIFMNLISNGIKYNREQGSLTVALSRRDGSVLVEVSDTGIGMSASEMEGLFHDFYRVKNPQTAAVPGTGLGLATVRRVLHEYGGEVAVRSEPGKGTTFTVNLPAAS